MEGNQLYSKNTDLNVNLIQNPLTEMPRKMFDHISEHCGPAKWPHKINHYNNQQDWGLSFCDPVTSQIKLYFSIPCIASISTSRRVILASHGEEPCAGHIYIPFLKQHQ